VKFSEFKYIRPDYLYLKSNFIDIVSKIEKAKSYNYQKSHIEEINKLRNDIESMKTIVSIRYGLNTKDKFYIDEKQYWDDYGPIYDELNSMFYKSIVNSKYKDEIVKDFGRQFLKICEYSIKVFSSDIISELQEENRLCSKYTKLLASAEIEFDGKLNNLSGVNAYLYTQDRKSREEASKKYYQYFEEHQFEFDN